VTQGICALPCTELAVGRLYLPNMPALQWAAWLQRISHWWPL